MAEPSIDPALMSGVIPYLCMDGRAGEALGFYAAAFGGVEAARMPGPDGPARLMHAEILINGRTLMLTDFVSDGQAPARNFGHLQLVVRDGRAWFNRAVTAGCTVLEPYAMQFWGDEFGLKEDPFGFKWAVLQPGPGRGAGDVTVVTYDWVPEQARGFVRDLRVRWALEEAGLPYRVETTPFHERAPDHLAHQPFNQVPWLRDGDETIFESGAILLHLGERSAALLPADPPARRLALQWAIAALNSMEPAILPVLIQRFANDPGAGPGAQALSQFLAGRLARIEAVLVERTWLAGAFSIADILMADALRLLDAERDLDAHPAIRAYVARATARPAFRKAHADQLAQFAAADEALQGAQ